MLSEQKKKKKMWHLTSTLQRPNKGEKERKARMMAAAARDVVFVSGMSGGRKWDQKVKPHKMSQFWGKSRVVKLEIGHKMSAQ